MQTLHPDQTALLLIGFQRDYFDPDGTLNPVIQESNRVSGTLENTLAVIESLEDSAVSIISTPIVFSETYAELDDPVGILKTIKEVEAFRRGTRGAETIDAINDFGKRIQEIPGKRGFDAFSNTDLGEVLRKNDIRTVAIAGAVTSICVNATALRALDEGFDVIILSDCTSSRTPTEQEFFCDNVFPLFANVIGHEQFVESLKSSG